MKTCTAAHIHTLPLSARRRRLSARGVNNNLTKLTRSTDRNAIGPKTSVVGMGGRNEEGKVSDDKFCFSNNVRPIDGRFMGASRDSRDGAQTRR